MDASGTHPPRTETLRLRIRVAMGFAGDLPICRALFTIAGRACPATISASKISEIVARHALVAIELMNRHGLRPL
jgi:TRAP-type uncharacterized transport system fused permease subunit